MPPPPFPNTHYAYHVIVSHTRTGSNTKFSDQGGKGKCLRVKALTRENKYELLVTKRLVNCTRT